MAYMPPGRRRSWNKASELLLKEVGLVRRSTARVCGIRKSLEKLDQRIPELDWQRLFGAKYAQAERQIVEAAARQSYAEADHSRREPEQAID